MADAAVHSVSVAGVVVDDAGRALLIQRRDNGHWEPPGGVLETGEDIIAGLRREVAELAVPAHAIRVFDALDLPSPPAIRAHDGVHLT
jgi:ADP-ribose pyrophosphatase YjhB (NUDIX family)